MGNEWTGSAFGAIVTQDGGVAITGTTASNDSLMPGFHGLYDVMFYKVDSVGNINFNKCFGGTHADEGYSSIQLNDGSYIISAGAQSNDSDVTGNHGLKDGWILKTDTGGTIISQKCFGGSWYDKIHMTQPLASGGLLVLAEAGSNDGDVTGNHNSYDLWVIKLDNNNNMIANKCLGGTDKDSPVNFLKISNNEFLLCGYTNSNDGDVSGNHGWRDAWIARLDSSGNILWQQCLGGSHFDNLASAISTADGGYILAGSTTSNDGDVSGNHDTTGNVSDFWIVKLYPDTITPTTNPTASTLGLQIFPNPTTNNLTISLNNPITNNIITVFMYDVFGKQILSQRITTPNTKLQTKNFSSGIYFVKVVSGSNAWVQKFVKE